MANLKDTNLNGNLVLPVGNTSQRPPTPEPGYVRFNTSNNEIEIFNGTSWISFLEKPQLSASGAAAVYSILDSDIQYKVFVFKQDGQVTVNQAGYVDFLIVAGGGGGGGRGGGGGGAGGLIYKTEHFITDGTYTVTVGTGGNFGQGNTNGSSTHGQSGGNSSFLSFTSIGGGGGGGYINGIFTDDGGSGGGHPLDGESAPASKGLQPDQSGESGLYGYGNDGGRSLATSGWAAGGGGGGAGGKGQDGVVGGESGHGGNGLAFNISGHTVFYAAGGGAGDTGGSNNTGFGIGGNHTGGNGGQVSTRSGTTVPAREGASNTGSGGGGGPDRDESGDVDNTPGARGADGIVIIRHREPRTLTTQLGRINSGLQLYLDAGLTNSYQYNAEPNTVWKDLSGYNRDATLTNNAPFLYDGFEGAIQFERDEDQYVTVPHDSDISEQVFSDRLFATVEGWANVNTFRDWTTIITKATGGSYSNSTGPTLWSNENGFQFVVGKGVGGNPSDGSVRIDYTANINQWYHLAGTVNGRIDGNCTAKLYVNGDFIEEIVFDINDVGTVQENTSPITLGKRSTGSGPSIDGKIGLVAAYNRPLTAAEIKQNFEADRSRFGI